MSMMAFHLAGFGYGGFSGGVAYLAFTYDGSKQLYKAWCQGVGGGLVYSSYPFSIDNSLTGDYAGEYVLFNFGLCYVVKITVPDIFVGSGTVNLSFNINEKDSGKERYKVERQPTVKGVSTGAINITTVFHKKDLEDSDNQTIWENIWAGNSSILPSES
jgi:hypothetical protein